MGSLGGACLEVANTTVGDYKVFTGFSVMHREVIFSLALLGSFSGG